jgi:hypothetical protein
VGAGATDDASVPGAEVADTSGTDVVATEAAAELIESLEDAAAEEAEEDAMDEVN